MTACHQHVPHLGQATFFNDPLPVRKVITAFIDLARVLSLATNLFFLRCKGLAGEYFAPPPTAYILYPSAYTSSYGPTTLHYTYELGYQRLAERLEPKMRSNAHTQLDHGDWDPGICPS